MRPDKTLWEFGGRNRKACSRLLNFICVKQYPTIWIKEPDFIEIEHRFKKDENTLFRWSTSSSFVDFIARKLLINNGDLINFVGTNNFNPEQTYKPGRNSRENWIFSVTSRLEDEPLLQEIRHDENKPEKSSAESEIMVDREGKHFIISDSGVKVFVDYKDNLIIDKNDPAVAAQANRSKYARGKVKGLSYLGSENSEDALTWNFFRSLMKVPLIEWVPVLLRYFNIGSEEYGSLSFHFWRKYSPPPSRKIREGNTFPDLTIETPTKLIFIEVKYKSEISSNTKHDAKRDQIIRNIDVGSWAANISKKEFQFAILVQKSSRFSIETLNYYRTQPEGIKERIGSYRDDIADFSYLANRIYIIYWEEFISKLLDQTIWKKKGTNFSKLCLYAKDKLDITE